MSAAESCDSYPEVQLGRNNSHSRPYSNIQFTIFYYAFGHILVMSCGIAWLLLKGSFERTQMRPTLLVVMAILCSLTQMNYAPLQALIADRYPCWLGVVMTVMIVPFGAASIIGRLLFFSFSVQFSHIAYDTYRNNQADERDQMMSSFRSGSKHRIICNLPTVFRRAFFPTKVLGSETELYVLRFMVSSSGTRLIAAILCFPFFVLAMVLLATDPVYSNCFNCAVNTTMFITEVVIGAILVTFGLFFWLILHRLGATDKWGLKNECLYSLCCAIIALVGLILAGFTTGNVFPYSHQFLLTLGLWLFVMEQTVVQLYLAWKQPHSVRPKSVSIAIRPRSKQLAHGSSLTIRTSNTENPAHTGSVTGEGTSTLDKLDLVLKNKALRQELERYLVSEFAVESLFFLSDVDEWKLQFNDLTPKTRYARAKRICKAYVAAGSLYAVNISYDTAEPIRKRFKQKTESAEDPQQEDIDRAIFDDAYQEIRHLLANGALLRFCSTERYEEVLKESQAMSSSTMSLSGRISPTDDSLLSPPSPKLNSTRF